MGTPLRSCLAKFRESRLAEAVETIRSSKIYNHFVVAVTLYAVLMDDLKLALLPKSSDDTVRSLFWMCFGVFAFDITMSCIFEEGYVYSLIFFLDSLATLSMPFTLLLIPEGSGRELALGRLARLVRILRVIRVMRLAKFASEGAGVAVNEAQKKRQEAGLKDFSFNEAELRNDDPVGFKKFRSFLGSATFNIKKEATRRASNFRRSKPQQNATQKNDFGTMVTSTASSSAEVENESKNSKQSMIGRNLIEATNAKIILLILTQAVGTALLSYAQPDVSAVNGFHILHDQYPIYAGAGCFNASTLASSSTHCAEAPCCESWEALLTRYVRGQDYEGTSIRVKHLTLHGATYMDEDLSSLRDVEKDEHISGDSRIVIDFSELTAVIAWWDVSNTVLVMIVMMVFPYMFGKDVMRIVITPLEVIFDRVQTLSLNPFVDLGVFVAEDLHARKTYELDMIKAALSKLTKLLQIGLGPAASDIIARNLTSGDFSALQAGSRVNAIYGFCDIRNFTDSCEQLKEECVIFVNSIAVIVSDQMTISKGAINKNIGDAFLLVWKHADDVSEDPVTTRVMNKTREQATEKALRAVVNMITGIKNNKSVQEFTKNPNMRKRFGDDHEVSLGFGLHYGWSIEGAVGSEQKIDATYLSPHIDITETLEDSTKRYKCPLLLSHWFCEALSENTMKRVRKVDAIKAPGESRPMTMYTWEFDSKIAADKTERVESYFEPYIKGDWVKAKTEVESFLEAYPGDGPAKAILTFMDENDFVPPSNWEGFRNDD